MTDSPGDSGAENGSTEVVDDERVVDSLGSRGGVTSWMGVLHDGKEIEFVAA